MFRRTRTKKQLKTLTVHGDLIIILKDCAWSARMNHRQHSSILMSEFFGKKQFSYQSPMTGRVEKDASFPLLLVDDILLPRYINWSRLMPILFAFLLPSCLSFFVYRWPHAHRMDSYQQVIDHIKVSLIRWNGIFSPLMKRI